MKTSIKTLVIAILMTTATTAEAQIFKKLGEKVTKAVERTVERKAEEKAERTTENAIDSLLTPKERKRQARKNTKKNGMGNMGGIMDDILNPKEVVTKDVYTFPITATMEVTSYEKNQRTDIMKQSYGKDAILAVVDVAPNPIITDFTNQAAIIINDEDKTAQVMSLSWMQKMGQMGNIEPDEDTTPATVIKTGNTKQMNGYTCHEYIIKHERTKINAWFAPDVPFDYKDYLQGFTKMVGAEVANLPKDKGYVMQMDIEDNGEALTSMKVTNLDTTPKTFTLSDYTIKKMF